MFASDSYLEDLAAPESAESAKSSKSSNQFAVDKEVIRQGDNGQVSGLTILGTAFGCGKTVLVTGFAAMLSSYGFNVRAIKPIVIGASKNIEAELAFISSITRTVPDHSPIFCHTSHGLSQAD